MSQTPIDTTVFASDLVAMIDDLPAVAYYSTAPAFNVSVTALTSEQTLLIVGNNDRAAIQARFPITAIGTYATPAIQSRFAIKMPGQAATANYEVVTRDLSQDGVEFMLILKADNRLP